MNFHPHFQVHFPDIEFFVNLGDWPLEKRKINEGPTPLFSWCGSEDSRDIIMPTYDLTESSLEMMSRYMCRWYNHRQGTKIDQFCT